MDLQMTLIALLISLLCALAGEVAGIPVSFVAVVLLLTGIYGALVRNEIVTYGAAIVVLVLPFIDYNAGTVLAAIAFSLFETLFLFAKAWMG